MKSTTLISLAAAAYVTVLAPIDGHEYRSGEMVMGEDLQTQDSTPLPEVSVEAVQSVIDQYKLWDPLTQISVCFMGGEEALRKYFVAQSAEWDKIASVDFDFGAVPGYRNCDVKHPSQIRVSFVAGGGNWSLVGTDALNEKPEKATLNISVVQFATANKRALGGTILHELGHALAMKHEHQSPESKCDDQIDWPRLYAEMALPPNKWDKAKVDHNIRQFVESPRLLVTAYDRKSIMHYSLPPEWFKQGKDASCWVPRNDTLSPTDIASIRDAYPDTPQKQDKYIANLDVISATALDELNLSDDSIKKIGEVINRSLSAIPERTATSDFVQTIINNRTLGACSPILSGSGDLTITCTINGK